MPDSPSSWVRFVANSKGELELVITKEVWEIIHAAAHGEGSLWIGDDSVRIDLRVLLEGRGILSIQTIPPSQNPPCENRFSVEFEP